MKKVLITGAGGFIARNFIEAYGGRYDMVYVDKVSNCTDVGFLDSLPQDLVFRHSSSWVGVDFLRRHGITHVINFAAESHVDNSISGPLEFTLSNTCATHSLLEACRQSGQIEKFVQIGTDEVYGTLGADDRPFNEETPLTPNSPYSASKAAQDMMCRAYWETFKFPVVTTRCSNNYGPWQHPEKFVPKVIKNILNNEKIPVYGEGTNIRDWIHVEDHCRGIMLALEYGEPGMVYNFGGDCEVNNLDVIQTVIDVVNDLNEGLDQPRLELDDIVTFVEDRKGHDFRYSIDFWRARRDLGFEPFINFYDGIVELVQWAAENEDWLNARK